MEKLRDRLGELKLALPALMENLPPDADDKTHQAIAPAAQAARMAIERMSAS